MKIIDHRRREHRNSLFGRSLNNAAASNFRQIPASPLVLGLNGDGVKLASYGDSPVLFEADSDGGPLEQTGRVDSIVAAENIADGAGAAWATALCISQNNNSGIAEVFSVADFNARRFLGGASNDRAWRGRA